MERVRKLEPGDKIYIDKKCLATGMRVGSSKNMEKFMGKTFTVESARYGGKMGEGVVSLKLENEYGRYWWALKDITLIESKKIDYETLFNENSIFILNERRVSMSWGITVETNINGDVFFYDPSDDTGIAIRNIDNLIMALGYLKQHVGDKDED